MKSYAPDEDLYFIFSQLHMSGAQVELSQLFRIDTDIVNKFRPVLDALDIQFGRTIHDTPRQRLSDKVEVKRR